MEDLQKYLSTAPVLLTIWLTFTAGFIIEINRFPRYVTIIFLNSYF
jgi:photosystem I subunit 9